jgi:hypothetical protein
MVGYCPIMRVNRGIFYQWVDLSQKSDDADEGFGLTKMVGRL